MIRGIVEDKGWKRPIEFMPSLHKAIQSGARKKEEFQHVDYSGEMLRNLTDNLPTDDLRDHSKGKDFAIKFIRL